MISISRRNGCGLRRQRWPTVGVVFVFALLGVVAISGQARSEVKVEKAVPVDSSAILEAALCVMKANPGQCVRQQAARVLTNWEDILNTKKIEILAEADQEVTAKQQSRGLSDAEIARGKPSTLMEQIETGLTALTEFVSDGVDEYVDDKQQEKAVEEATSKTHLHHLLHKLGNAGNGSAQDGASVARATDDEDYRDQLAAVEDGLVDYAGLAGGPDKALGRGKQEGDQADYGFGSGEHNAGNGGGSRSAIEGGRTAAGDGDGAELRQRHDATDEVGEARRAPAPVAAVRFDDDIGELRRRRTHTNGRADQLLPYYVLSKRKGKKKKTFMKLFILGAALKAKIELLLKILSFKLQLKFFAVAIIGLLINIARFWIDFKKQPSPQKVIYYEHAQHQHHYDDHGDGDFGGYWKRSLHALNDEEPYQGGHDRSERYDEPYPYRSPQYAPKQHVDPHAMAYQQQRPY